MVYDLVLNERVVVLDALACLDSLIVLEEFEVEILHDLDILEDDGPIVVEMRL
jgi:hypothetical protein